MIFLVAVLVLNKVHYKIILRIRIHSFTLQITSCKKKKKKKKKKTPILTTKTNELFATQLKSCKFQMCLITWYWSCLFRSQNSKSVWSIFSQLCQNLWFQSLSIHQPGDCKNEILCFEKASQFQNL